MLNNVSHRRPAGSVPGIQAIVGSRMPPSKDVPLPSRNPPLDPAWSPYDSQGPLSPVKITNVRPVAPASRTAFRTRPTLSSISIMTSPYKPAPLRPSNSSDTNNGTWGSG